MKRSFAGLVVAVAVAFAGCNSKSTPGGPGAPHADAKKPAIGQAEDTFSLSTPTLSTNAKQGETKAVSIAIKRGKNFDEDVTLIFSGLPKGVTIDPSRIVIKHGEAEAKFNVQAANDAAVGDFTVKVTGHPTKGSDATSEFKLTVDKK